MTTKQWYRAHIRWAVMAEGKEGLRGWKESVYLFLSEDHDTAFRRALEIGRCHQVEHQEGRKWVETRLVDIVTLDNLGSNPIHALFKNQNAAAAGLWKKPVRGKRGKPKAGFPRFPPPLEIAHNPRDSHFSHSPDCCWYLYEPNY